MVLVKVSLTDNIVDEPTFEVETSPIKYVDDEANINAGNNEILDSVSF